MTLAIGQQTLKTQTLLNKVIFLDIVRKNANKYFHSLLILSATKYQTAFWYYAHKAQMCKPYRNSRVDDVKYVSFFL